MSALGFGNALGRGVGKTANVLWNGAVILASAAGDVGTGFVAGAESGWDDQDLVMQAAMAKRAAARDAQLEAFMAAKAAAAAALVPDAPARKGKMAAAS